MVSAMFRTVLVVMAMALASPVIAQESARPPATIQTVPDRLVLSKLIWSTMAAVHHANQSGNYSVLRDMASPAFQAANDPASLVLSFSGLRASNIDLSNALLLAPTYRTAPTLENGILHVQGFFGIRPTSLMFNFRYQWIGGQWKLYSIGIQERDMATQMNAPTTR